MSLTCCHPWWHYHHLPLPYLAGACYDLKSEIADLKEHAVEVAAVVHWCTTVVDVAAVVVAAVTEPVSTTHTKKHFQMMQIMNLLANIRDL